MPETDPRITLVCTRCGSDAVIPDAFLYLPEMGSGVTLQVGVHRNPDAILLKRSETTAVQMRVCGDCGLIETESADPGALWSAYVDRLARQLDG